MSDKSMIFDITKPAPADKPDNSPTFFSARKPASAVYPMSAQSTVYPKSADHPWRYFVADGESLNQIYQCIAAAKTVEESLNALAAEFGAESMASGHFVFPNAQEEPVPPKLRFVYQPNEVFVCDASAAGDFFPDMRYGSGDEIKKRMLSIAKLPADEIEAARSQLAKTYKATSFDGKFFHFENWEVHVEAAPMHEKQYRLKANPSFVRRPSDRDWFCPDMETDEGFKIAQRLSEITSRQYPQQRFADWIASFALDISLNGSESRDRNTAECEKIGDEWILKVPVIVEGIFGVDGKGGVRTGEKEGWVMPPDAKPIAVSEYYAKLEKCGTLRVLPTITPTSV